MKLTGNTVLITGGATGIGFAMAEAFLKAGNEIIICGRREARLLDARKKHPEFHGDTDHKQAYTSALPRKASLPPFFLSILCAGKAVPWSWVMKEHDVRQCIESFLKRTTREVVIPASIGLGLVLGGCRDVPDVVTDYGPCRT